MTRKASVSNLTYSDESVQIQEGTATISYVGDDLLKVLETAVYDRGAKGIEWGSLKMDERQRNRVTGKHPWVLTIMG